MRPISRVEQWKWQEIINVTNKGQKALNGHQSVYFNRLMDLADPVEANDAVNKQYVDNLLAESDILFGVAEVALPAGAATSAKQDTQIAAEQAILAKIIAAPATEAKQDTGNASLDSISADIATVKADIALVKADVEDIEVLLETTGITLLPLSATLDSIDVSKKSKGAVTAAHSAITATATSAEIDCRGFNSVLIKADISAAKNWTFKVQGCMTSGGTFVDWYEMANTGTMTLMSYQTNASRGWVWHGIPDYIKIVATKDEDTATVTVKVQPFNA